MKKLRTIFSKNNPKSEESSEEQNLVPASSGDSMLPFVHWLHTYSTLQPTNIFEIGANMAQDAEVLRASFGLSPKDVWVFEPHPTLYKYIKSHYAFNAFDYAVLNKNKDVVINAINLEKNSNTGISSAREHRDVPVDHFDKVKVEGVRMDTFLKKHKVKSVDFLKLDVEGCNYEVLEGFGKSLDSIKCMHVEAEHYEHWKGEKMWEDIRALLEPHFEMVFFERHFTQSDSFWIKKEYLK